VKRAFHGIEEEEERRILYGKTGNYDDAPLYGIFFSRFTSCKVQIWGGAGD
jgi:hypothetical protein